MLKGMLLGNQIKQPGSVSKSFFAYLSLGQWLTLGAVSMIVIVSWEQLSTAFLTNIPLNGLIISVMLIGLGRAIASNVQLWRTSLYLHRIDDLVNGGEEPTEAHVTLFRRQLKRSASVLDTKQMSDLLGNLTRYGHLNVTDNDARMVKSKLGFRVSKMRENTGFLAGMLVMLGLLGTFWGLLATIDAVGQAMGGMANIGEADASAMSGFIGKIAAPLEGMGLAFSSSLFGLSGSLLIGFFNFLCGGVHNLFIESVSRWIDERIPAPPEKAKKAQQNPKVANSDELKAWLAGFVQTSLATNQKIVKLIEAMTEITASTLATEKMMRESLQNQAGMQEELLEHRRAYARGLHVVRKEINDRSFDLAARLRRLGAGPVDFGEVTEASQAAGQGTLYSELEKLLQRDDILAALKIDDEGLPQTGIEFPKPTDEPAPDQRPDV